MDKSSDTKKVEIIATNTLDSDEGETEKKTVLPTPPREKPINPSIYERLGTSAEAEKPTKLIYTQ